MSSLVERFATLFDGNERSHGVWSPKSGKMFTDPRPAEIKDYEEHINGGTGLGIIPIRDDNHCFFGVIDIDNHGEQNDLPIQEIERRSKSNGLPLLICRSKSGGVHGYVFFMDPVPANLARKKLTAWAKTLGYPRAEIFPKQDKLLTDPDGTRQLGNWINLPYFNIAKTNRFCVHQGEALEFEEFVDLAEASLVTEAALVGASSEHPDAPPCVQKMLAEGVDAGLRNEGLYNITVYLKKAFPDDYRDRAFDINNQVISPPLPMIEARRTIGSAGRREYKYKCDEEPIKSLCNRPKCLQCKFGVGSDSNDPNATNHSALPMFSELTKYLTDPIKWSIKMDGIRVENLETEDILRYSRMERIIVERLGRGAPMLKERDWRAIINAQLETHVIMDVPDDASTSGLIRARLIEFAKKASISLNGEFGEDRSLLMRGLPIVYKPQDDKEFIAFRGQDFVDFLKRTKAEEMKGTNLFFAIKTMGLEYHNIRVGDQVVKCWCIPMNEDWKTAIKPVTFHRDF